MSRHEPQLHQRLTETEHAKDPDKALGEVGMWWLETVYLNVDGFKDDPMSDFEMTFSKACIATFRKLNADGWPVGPALEAHMAMAGKQNTTEH